MLDFQTEMSVRRVRPKIATEANVVQRGRFMASAAGSVWSIPIVAQAVPQNVYAFKPRRRVASYRPCPESATGIPQARLTTGSFPSRPRRPRVVQGLASREGIADVVFLDPTPSAVRILPAHHLLQQRLPVGRFAELVCDDQVQRERLQCRSRCGLLQRLQGPFPAGPREACP
jgi:hypothetical protein